MSKYLYVSHTMKNLFFYIVGISFIILAIASLSLFISSIVSFLLLLFFLLFLLGYIYSFFNDHKYIVLVDEFHKDKDLHLTGMRGFLYKSKENINVVICKHCFKSIVFSQMNLNCPYCSTAFPGDMYPKSSVHSALAVACHNCGRIIRYFNCPHCSKEIDTFEHYDPEELIAKEFARK